MATRAEAEQRVNIGFGIHFFVYLAVVSGLAYLNYTRNPDNLWVLWVAGGWGLGILLHAVLAFTPKTREKAIDRKLQRMEKRESRQDGREMTDRMSEAGR
jgi:uncharacterized membrane protein YbhN (UPF0104 family)